MTSLQPLVLRRQFAHNLKLNSDLYYDPNDLWKRRDILYMKDPIRQIQLENIYFFGDTIPFDIKNKLLEKNLKEINIERKRREVQKELIILEYKGEIVEFT